MSLITELLTADTVLLGTPMYNFSVPASLKAWIYRSTFPGAFTDPESGDRLLCDTRVVVVTARGGSYGPGTPREGFDFQMPYLRAYFRQSRGGRGQSAFCARRDDVGQHRAWVGRLSAAGGRLPSVRQDRDHRFGPCASSRTESSSWRRRCGSLMTLTATIRSPSTTSSRTSNSRPCGATIAPRAPFTRAARA